MVSEPVFIAVLAGVFTVLGAGITAGTNYISARRSSKEAVARLYHQHAQEEKFNAIRDLYLSLDDTVARFRQANLSGVSSFEDYEEKIWQPYRDMRTMWDIASIYITDDADEETVEDFLNQLNDLRTYLRSWAQASDTDWRSDRIAWDYEMDNEDIQQSFEDVKDVLRPMLDPPTIEP